MNKGTVYFVDDEMPVLSSLRRALRIPMKGWDVRFEQSPLKALESMQECAPWVVIVDRKMPEMEGSEFLSKVQEQYPEAIRVLLTGDTSYKTAAKVAPYCHLMLAKPFELDDIIAVIDRAVCLRKFEVSDDVRRALGSITTLPVIPACYLELVEYFKSESEPEIQVVAELISKDISILSKIIQTANSSFFGSVTAVFTAQGAIVRLGFDLVTKLVFCFEMHASAQDEEKHRKLISEAEQVAKSCVHLSSAAQMTRSDKERSYFTGLVHNIGELVLEQYELDIPSSVVSAFLMQLWGFDQVLVDALKYQDSPEGFSAEDPVALHLFIAKQLVSAEKKGLSREDIWGAFASELLEKANLREYVGESDE